MGPLDWPLLALCWRWEVTDFSGVLAPPCGARWDQVQSPGSPTFPPRDDSALAQASGIPRMVLSGTEPFHGVWMKLIAILLPYSLTRSSSTYWCIEILRQLDCSSPSVFWAILLGRG